MKAIMNSLFKLEVKVHKKQRNLTKSKDDFTIYITYYLLNQKIQTFKSVKLIYLITKEKNIQIV